MTRSLRRTLLTSIGWLPCACFSEAPVVPADTDGPDATETGTTAQGSTSASTSGTGDDDPDGTTGTTAADAHETTAGETTAGETTEADCDLPYIRTHGVLQSYAVVPLVAAEKLRLVDTPFTVEYWIRVDGDPVAEEGAYVGSVSDDPPAGWSLSITGGVLRGWAGFGHNTSQRVLEDGEWHHVAWSYDEVHSRLFVDGLLVDADDVTKDDTPSMADLYVGVSPAFNQARAGDLRALRISAVARYGQGPFEPEQSPEVDGDTIGLWLFDDGSGDTAANQAGGPVAMLHDVTWGCDLER